MDCRASKAGALHFLLNTSGSMRPKDPSFFTRKVPKLGNALVNMASGRQNHEAIVAHIDPAIATAAILRDYSHHPAR